MVLAVLGAAAVVFAGLMLFQRTLYGSAMCLLVVLLQVGGLFFALGAQIVGLMQVLVYAGAIMVLVVISVMAGPPRLEELWARFPVPPALAAAVLGLLALEFVSLALLGGPALAHGPAAVPAGFEREMAGVLFGRYALMTEAIGVLILLAALAVVPTRDER